MTRLNELIAEAEAALEELSSSEYEYYYWQGKRNGLRTAKVILEPALPPRTYGRSRETQTTNPELGTRTRSHGRQ